MSEPGRNYRAGEKIEGKIRVSVDGYFDASAISLRLHGVEKACFTPPTEGRVSPYIIEKNWLKMILERHEFRVTSKIF